MTTLIYNPQYQEVAKLNVERDALLREGWELKANPVLSVVEADNRDFMELAEAYGVEDDDFEDNARQLFVDSINKLPVGPGSNVLSDKGLSAIYDLLIDSGDNLHTMVENLHRILASYQEGNAKDVLYMSDMDMDEVDALDDADAVAVEFLSNHDYTSLYDSYELNGETIYLYGTF